MRPGSANLAFREQLTRMRATDVLIGMHGAGLAHQIFLHEVVANLLL